MHQSGALLIEVLHTAVLDEYFPLLIDYHDASNNSREFYQRCGNDIRKQEWKNAKTASVANASQSSAVIPSKDVPEMPQLLLTSTRYRIAVPVNVLFDRTGRRYRTKNARRQNRRSW